VETALDPANTAMVRERYPIVLHGVGLNLLSHEPLSSAYLDQLVKTAASAAAQGSNESSTFFASLTC